MLASLEQAAYLEPTPVQAGIIPRALAGVDVLGPGPHRHRQDRRVRDSDPRTAQARPQRRAAAGAGARAHARAGRAGPRRIRKAGPRPARFPACRSTAASRFAARSPSCSEGPTSIVGTPGRVLDLIGRGALDLRSIRIVVLDEADRMLDIGFRPDIEKILRRCPKERQTLLLSATVAPPVERLARTYMRDPEVMDFSPKTNGGRHDRAVLLHRRSRAEVRPAGATAQARAAGAGDRLLPHEARHRADLPPAEQELPRRRHDARRHGARRPATA